MDLNEVLESERPAEYLYRYALDNGRLSPEWERLLLEFKNTWYINLYAENIVKGRWPEAEPILLESKNYYNIMWYAKYVIGDKWPEAELALKECPYWRRYCRYFNIKE